MRKRLVAAAALALLVLALAAPPAFAGQPASGEQSASAASSTAAIDVFTRIQGLEDEISAPLPVSVPQQLTVTDSNGFEVACSFPNPLAALFLTAGQGGYGFTTTYGGGFIGSIAGIGGQDSWWLYAVEGCIPMVGVLDWQLAGGEKILYFEAGGDAQAPWANKELVLDCPSSVAAGQEVVIRVLGDDLQKANSAADAPKFGLDPLTSVETPDQFQPVPGATLHLGDRSYVADANGRVVVGALAAGAYPIWAEMPFDSQWQYISSSPSRLFISEFTDVRSSHPNYLAIHRVATRGIATGYPVGSGQEFRPDATLYRAQFAKMISLALGLQIVKGAPTPFQDLGERQADNPYPHDYVAAAYAAGIVKGVTATGFGTYDTVSRAQVVTMITRAANVRGLLETPEVGFISAWGNFSPDHAAYARLAEWNGLLDGLDLNGPAADPWASMSRGETAQVIDNLVQLVDSRAE